MTRPRGYHPGDWLAECFQCGTDHLASTMVRHWQGYYVCRRCWEPRHPQEFVRGVADNQTVPWAQPPTETFVGVCNINSQSAIPAYAVGGCMIPGREYIDPDVAHPAPPPLCDIYEVQGVPGWAGPGCAVPNFDPFAA